MAYKLKYSGENPDQVLMRRGFTPFIAHGHQPCLSNADLPLNLAKVLVNRLRFELVPLLNEYLQEGRLGSCESELRAYIDWLEGELVRHA